MIKYFLEIRHFFVVFGLCCISSTYFYGANYAHAAQKKTENNHSALKSDKFLNPVMVHKLSGLALKGFDPVAYFSESEAKGGSAEFEHSWQGNTWRFISNANLQVFKENQEAFLPQFGGTTQKALRAVYLLPHSQSTLQL